MRRAMHLAVALAIASYTCVHAQVAKLVPGFCAPQGSAYPLNIELYTLHDSRVLDSVWLQSALTALQNLTMDAVPDPAQYQSCYQGLVSRHPSAHSPALHSIALPTLGATAYRVYPMSSQVACTDEILGRRDTSGFPGTCDCAAASRCGRGAKCPFDCSCHLQYAGYTNVTSTLARAHAIVALVRGSVDGGAQLQLACPWRMTEERWCAAARAAGLPCVHDGYQAVVAQATGHNYSSLPDAAAAWNGSTSWHGAGMQLKLLATVPRDSDTAHDAEKCFEFPAERTWSCEMTGEWSATPQTQYFAQQVLVVNAAESVWMNWAWLACACSALSVMAMLV